MVNEYIYIDRSKKQNNPEIVFKCFASDILEADKLYEAEKNINPGKQPYIGCQIFSKIYNLLGIAIESHIRNYNPKDWIEPIRVCFNAIPFINPEKAKKLADSYKSNQLEQSLVNDEDKSFRKFPCLVSAVKDFFDKGKHKEFLD